MEVNEREVSQLLEAASDELAEYDERYARVEEKLAQLPRSTLRAMPATR